MSLVGVCRVADLLRAVGQTQPTDDDLQYLGDRFPCRLATTGHQIGRISRPCWHRSGLSYRRPSLAFLQQEPHQLAASRRSRTSSKLSDRRENAEVDFAVGWERVIAIEEYRSLCVDTSNRVLCPVLDSPRLAIYWQTCNDYQVAGHPRSPCQYFHQSTSPVVTSAMPAPHHPNKPMPSTNPNTFSTCHISETPNLCCQAGRLGEP